MRRAALALLSLAACYQPVDLTPAATPTAEVAVARSGDVIVALQPTRWPSPIAIDRVVTPMRVVVENRGAAPVRVLHADFTLVTSDGRRLRALAPQRIQGKVDAPVLEPSPPAWPPFRARGFVLDPAYEGSWPPGDDDGSFLFDDHSVVFDRVQLPTRDMLARAVPEGTLLPGGRLDGWLFFDHLPESVEVARFHAAVVEAGTGVPLGEVAIPLVAG